MPAHNVPPPVVETVGFETYCVEASRELFGLCTVTYGDVDVVDVDNVVEETT